VIEDKQGSTAVPHSFVRDQGVKSLTCGCFVCFARKRMAETSIGKSVFNYAVDQIITVFDKTLIVLTVIAY
jgi:hypothetical protein